LLSSLHAARGEELLPVASFAIAVTHWLKGVPFVPSAASERFLLWSSQWRP
jgi:hypothetical protein